jgi:hypothetical protein
VGFDTLQWSSLCSPLAKSPVRGVNNVPPTIEWEIREQRDALVDTRAVGSARGANGQRSVAEVSLTYLQRHGVPCQSVVKVVSTNNLDEVAICQDGRERLISLHGGGRQRVLDPVWTLVPKDRVGVRIVTSCKVTSVIYRRVRLDD